ncbi:hypothetical protein [Nocardia sp. NPDC050717]|uniref:hypothetical protein n=1 Tax=Nocardia sp. NPDC050717 TaxID=3157221 RepID=UPI0033ED70C3
MEHPGATRPDPRDDDAVARLLGRFGTYAMVLAVVMWLGGEATVAGCLALVGLGVWAARFRVA